jgi:prepilin-type processing-associated H-X9-DG protein
VNLSIAKDGLDNMQAMGWQTVLKPHLGGNATNLVCPEYAKIMLDRGEAVPEESPSPLPLSELAAFRVNGQWFDDLGEGPFVAKLSDANWMRARGAGWLVESANNFKREDWQDGSENTANPYWLCLEDHGNDWDQKDVMVKVTIRGDVYVLELMSGSTGHSNYIVDKPDHKEISPQIVSRTAFGSMEPITLGGGGGITTYGMNVAVPKTLKAPGKILVMDYNFLMASPEDVWSDAPHPDNRMIPSFARHRELMNVLFVDGSVKTTDPFDIDPKNTAGNDAIRRTLWIP